MTDKTIHYSLRASRDHIIDLLNFANTYPLQDLPVPQAQLTIPFGNTAKVAIEYSQKEVRYQLHSIGGEPITKVGNESELIESYGNGGMLILTTNPINEDVTYKIFAIKEHKKQTLSTYLINAAVIKVGLDTGLKAEISGLPFLDTTNLNPLPTDTRIADYGKEVVVNLFTSQEGVEYLLVVKNGEHETEISKDAVTGNLGAIELIIPSVTEDVDIIIKAVKTFTDGRPTEVAYLDTVLPLRVRASPAVALTIPAGQIISFNGKAVITLQNTQQSAEYKLFLHTILDEEIVHLPPADQNFLMVPVPDQPDVPIRKPSYVYRWTNPPQGFAEISSFQYGTGGDLSFTLPSLTHESMIIVQARKHHKRMADAANTTTIPSYIQLMQPLAVLVRPNPDQPIRLKTEVIGDHSGNKIEVFDGQLGVFYQLQFQPDGSEVGRPAYFHKRDERDVSQNKGIDQLTIEVDFVIPRPFIDELGKQNPSQTAPLPPTLEIAPISVDSTLQVTAVKAMTRVSTVLNQSAHIPTLPEIKLQDDVVDFNTATKILVIASIEGDRYEPFVNGESMKRALLGKGTDLSFNTDPLTETTEFELRITRPDDMGIQVERFVKLTAVVRPNATLPVTAESLTVEPNTEASLHVEGSQLGVSYQIVVDGALVGTAVEGTGDSITLNSDPLTEDTIFSIRATKMTDDTVFVILSQTVTVAVNS